MKMSVMARVYDGLKDDEREELDEKKKKKKKHKKHKAHEVGPNRRDLAKWGDALHHRLETPEERERVEADEHDIVTRARAGPASVEEQKTQAELMEEGINKAFKYGPTIGRDRFKKLLVALSKDDPVEEIEVDWVMASVDTNHTGNVSRSQLNEVKCALAKYILARHEVHETFAKYDKDSSAILTREEVRQLLTDLNNGIRCTDEELSLVMKNASKFRTGALVQPEFQAAINFWYTNVHPPVEEALSSTQDRCKGGAVGRAHTGMKRRETEAQTACGLSKFHEFDTAPERTQNHASTTRTSRSKHSTGSENEEDSHRHGSSCSKTTNTFRSSNASETSYLSSNPSRRSGSSDQRTRRHRHAQKESWEAHFGTAIVSPISQTVAHEMHVIRDAERKLSANFDRTKRKLSSKYRELHHSISRFSEHLHETFPSPKGHKHGACNRDEAMPTHHEDRHDHHDHHDHHQHALPPSSRLFPPLPSSSSSSSSSE